MLKSPSNTTRRKTLLGIASIPLAAPLFITSCGSTSTEAQAPSEHWLKGESVKEVPLPPSIDAPGRTVSVDGGDLWLHDTGFGEEVILLLHAFTGSAKAWAYQISAFSSAGYRVIAPSLRGAHGTSAPVADINKIIEDIDILIDEVDSKNIHLVGTAFGGFVAVRYAVKYPQKLQTLAISCSLGGVSEPLFQEGQNRLMTSEFLALPPEIKELGPSYRHSNPIGVEAWLELVETSMSTAFKNVPTEQLTQMLEVLENGPVYSDLAALPMPVHLIYGGADMYAPPASARLLHEQIPRSQLTLIQEVGHSAFWEQPNVFNDAVLSFLDRH